MENWEFSIPGGNCKNFMSVHKSVKICEDQSPNIYNEIFIELKC